MKIKCYNPNHGKKGYEWDYKGKHSKSSDFWVVCPTCRKNLHIVNGKPTRGRKK